MHGFLLGCLFGLLLLHTAALQPRYLECTRDPLDLEFADLLPLQSAVSVAISHVELLPYVVDLVDVRAAEADHFEEAELSEAHGIVVAAIVHSGHGIELIAGDEAGQTLLLLPRDVRVHQQAAELAQREAEEGYAGGREDGGEPRAELSHVAVLIVVSVGLCAGRLKPGYRDDRGCGAR